MALAFLFTYATPIALNNSTKNSFLSSPSSPQSFSTFRSIKHLEMAVQEVNRKWLYELEAMGFPLAQATRALHYSGNSSLEAAIGWVVDHENDPDIDQMPLVPVTIEIEASKPSHITEVVKLKAQELRDRARRTKEEEEKKVEREREKKRIRSGEELLEAKRIMEENERKRFIDLRKADKEEETRARDRIRQKLHHDKLERRWRLGLPSSDPSFEPTTLKQEKKDMSAEAAILPVKSAAKAELMRECLRSLRRNHRDNDTKVKRTFRTLLVIVGNVARNPDEEKYRKIRLSNPIFQDKIGDFEEGIEFLEICGFERAEGNKFLYLQKEKIDPTVFRSAGTELQSAISNPFFGLLSK